MIELHRYIAGARATPFAYGTHDCATFAAGWVLARTGRDVTGGLAGRYTTLRGGLRVARAAGFANQVEIAASVLPPREGLPRTGDVVEVAAPEGPALGICSGEAVHLLTHDGVTAYPAGRAVRAFKVI